MCISKAICVVTSVVKISNVSITGTWTFEHFGNLSHDEHYCNCSAAHFSFNAFVSIITYRPEFIGFFFVFVLSRAGSLNISEAMLARILSPSCHLVSPRALWLDLCCFILFFFVECVLKLHFVQFQPHTGTFKFCVLNNTWWRRYPFLYVLKAYGD